MNIAPEARANLEKLMRLARAESDALRSDLADVEAAYVAAQASLENLMTEARHQEQPGEGVRERFRLRRHKLFVTIETLERAAEDAREKLAASFAEANKLEALIVPGAEVEAAVISAQRA